MSGGAHWGGGLWINALDLALLGELYDAGTVYPSAPRSGRCARGNLGRHLLWVDPARRLVVASHWGEEVGRLLAEVSAAVSPTVTGPARTT